MPKASLGWSRSSYGVETMGSVHGFSFLLFCFPAFRSKGWREIVHQAVRKGQLDPLPQDLRWGNPRRATDSNYRPCTIHTRSDQLPILPPLRFWQPIFVSVESFNGMFRSSFPLLRKSEPPVQVQDTIITAWTIRHPTRNRNDPIARAELYQLSYIPPSQVGACMKESNQSFILFLGAAGPSWTWTRDLAREVNHRTYGPSNWDRINRFLFGSDSSFPNAAYNYPLYCALQVCLFPLFPYHDKSLWNNYDEKKKRR